MTLGGSIATQAITFHAPGKVNLHLAVGSERADGYHEVVTVLHALELGDVVTVEPAEILSVTCVPDVGVPSEDNTAHRAAVALGGILGHDPAVRVVIEKHIPQAAGLGGGSTDAAAVIVALARMWGVDPAGPEALSAASAVGADVPFFLTGGAALYGGRGDHLQRVLPALEADVVLVNCGAAISSGAAYARFDELGAPSALATPDRPEAMIAALESADLRAVAEALGNDLQDAAETLEPDVRPTREWLAGRPGVLGALVAGSGATVFGLCESADAARAVAAEAAERGWWSMATRTARHGVRVVEVSGS